MKTPARLTPGYAERRIRIRKKRKEESLNNKAADRSDSLAKRLLAGKPAILTAMMAVLVIISSMLAMVAVGRQPLVEDMRQKKAKKEVEVLNIALDMFRSDCGRYPTEKEGLVALVQNPGLTNWMGPYVNLIKPDPWYKRYNYVNNDSDTRAWSSGPDQIVGTSDDIHPSVPPKRNLSAQSGESAEKNETAAEGASF